MEPTEAAIEAAAFATHEEWARGQEYSTPYRMLSESDKSYWRSKVTPIVRAAFAAVPDPIPADVRSDIQKMVDVHRNILDPNSFGKYPMGEIAARVDASMRGENK